MTTRKVTLTIEISEELYPKLAEACISMIEDVFRNSSFMPPFTLRYGGEVKVKEAVGRSQWLATRDEMLAALGVETPLERALRGTTGSLELVGEGPLRRTGE